MFPLFLFLACSSSSQPPSSLQDGVIHVQSPATIGPAVPQAMGMKERVLSVFKATREEMVACYLPALELDPMQYGELIVGVDIRPDGTVSEAEIVFATIGDRAMQDCVLDRARSLALLRAVAWRAVRLRRQMQHPMKQQTSKSTTATAAMPPAIALIAVTSEEESSTS